MSLPPLLGQWRHWHANHLAVVHRIQPEIAAANRLLNGAKLTKDQTAAL